MLNAIQYFDQKSPSMIIAGKKDGSDDLGVFYSGNRQNLEMLRDLINEFIDQLQGPKDNNLDINSYAA